MLAVSCVLRSGGDYDPHYVVALARGVRQYLNMPHRFLCRTDEPAGVKLAMETANLACETWTLAYSWPGWFAKIEILELAGPILYLDLDTVIVGDITPLADVVLDLRKNEFLGLADLYRPEIWQTGIMGWPEAMAPVSTALFRDVAEKGQWKERPGRVYLQASDTKRYDGDAEWIRPHLLSSGWKLIKAQDVFPGIFSYKAAVQRTGLPTRAKIVCFHGHPRPAGLVAPGPMPAWMEASWGAPARPDA